MPKTNPPLRRPEGPDPLADLLTVTEAAEEKEVSTRAVTKAIQVGALPAWHKRALHLIPRDEVAKWAPQKRRRKETADD